MKLMRITGRIAAALLALAATGSAALGYEEVSLDPATAAALRNNLAVNQPVRLVLGDAENAEQGRFFDSKSFV